MSWTAPVPEVPDGPLVGAERPMVEAYLNYQRRTLLNISAGLSAEQLASRPIPSTNLTLLGLVRHMAKVERIWFRQRAGATGVEPLYDLSLGKDYDFDHISASDAPAAIDQLVEEWQLCDAAVAAMDFDTTFASRDDTMSLRMMYLHVINEYARHNGHADLLREAIDGVTDR